LEIQKIFAIKGIEGGGGGRQGFRGEGVTCSLGLYCIT